MTRRARVAVGVMVVAVAAGGCAPEQGAFDPAGPAARDLAALFWAMTAAGVAVVLLVVALLAAARRGERAPADDDRPSELDAHTVAQRDRRSTRLVVGGGILLPMVVLVPLAVTMLAVADRLSPRAGDAYEIEIVGHQFWWELRYPNGAVTANEIHVPVGEPVRLVMTSADVIHSVWVPELAGKIDMIPGETTELVIEADTPGEYLGQCTEFCGAQHARMRFLVIAQDRSTFDAWLARQARPTAPPGTAEAAAGAEVFVEVGCASCHTVRGTPADGDLGPDLTHVATRQTLAALAIDNERGQLAGWIADPQAIKPGALMPPSPLSGDQLNALVAYLEQLE